MADIRNGSRFSEEVIVLSSSDEEESKPDTRSSLNKVSTCDQQVNQDNISFEDNTFLKILRSYSMMEQENVLRSRITWKETPDSSGSQSNDRIPVSAGLIDKIENNSSCISNGVDPELLNSTDELLKKNMDSRVIFSSEKLNRSMNSDFDSIKAESEAAMESFLTVCRAFVDDEDGHKIIKSANKHYSSADIDFVHTKHFCDFMNKKSKDVIKDPQNVFLHIKDVLDELKPFRHKKRLCTSPPDDLISSDTTDISANQNHLPRISGNNDSNHLTNVECETASSAVSRRQPTEKQIKRLERLLQKIDKKIKHLQKKELSLDSMDDNESIYIQEDRFKKRFIKVWNKLCSLTGRSTETGRETEKKFHFNGSRYPEINEKISKFLNKRKIFPDYSDIINLVSSTNSILKLPDMQLHMLAREIFEEVGKVLKMRRHKDNRELIGCFLTDGIDFSNDPAEYNADLKSALQESSKKAFNDLDEIIDKYAQKQVELKIEPEDVQDTDDKSEHSSEEQEDENDDEIEHESETSDVEFIEGTVVSDDENDVNIAKENNEKEDFKDENDVNIAKENNEKEDFKVCHSAIEKSPSSTSLDMLGNCAEENIASNSNSSVSPPVPSLDLPCTSSSVPFLPSNSNGSKRPWQYDCIPFQAKIPCLESKNTCLANISNNETLLQKESKSQIDEDVIILE